MREAEKPFEAFQLFDLWVSLPLHPCSRLIHLQSWTTIEATNSLLSGSSFSGHFGSGQRLIKHHLTYQTVYFIWFPLYSNISNVLNISMLTAWFMTQIHFSHSSILESDITHSLIRLSQAVERDESAWPSPLGPSSWPIWSKPQPVALVA